jgi:glycerol dehydrogenase-like iron-containing ADH family enzyme
MPCKGTIPQRKGIMLLQSVNAYHKTTHGVAVGYGINILEELTKRYVEYYGEVVLNFPAEP